MADPGTGRKLVLATYNVHGCVGRDGRRDPERVAGVLAALGADVIALQEVASRDGDALARFADATGLAVLEGPTLRDDRGEFGNALLTRFEVRDVERVDLSLPGREPRGALDARLATPAGALRLIATHLGLRAGERVRQVERLLARVAGETGPLVLIGDWNEWRPGARTLRLLGRRLGRTPALRTFPARRPLLALDRIWAQPRDALRRIAVHATPAARVASDHLPVRAELQLQVKS